MHETSNTLADPNKEETRKTVMSLVLLAREWLNKVGAGNNREPVEPPLARNTKIRTYLHGLKKQKRMLQGMSCPSSEREDDVKGTQRQALTPASHNAERLVMAEKRNGSQTGVWPQRKEKTAKLIGILKLFKMWLSVLGIKTSRQNIRQVINERVKQNSSRKMHEK